jgi:chromate transporter
MNILLDLFCTFAYLALISFGGVISVLAEMERLVVVHHGWMSHQAFVEAFALGQLAPGPNMLYVFLIGHQVAGFPGALAAGLGMFGPTSLLLAGVAWQAGGTRRLTWIERFHSALGPVTIGLMAAAAWSLGRDLMGDIFLVGICGVAALLTARRLLDPAWVVLLAAVAGTLKFFFSG